jgi:hypothetical protein
VAYLNIRQDPAISLGTVTAPDEASAKQQAIEFYSIPPSQQFRVVAVRIEEAKKTKVSAKS